MGAARLYYRLRISVSGMTELYYSGMTIRLVLHGSISPLQCFCSTLSTLLYTFLECHNTGCWLTGCHSQILFTSSTSHLSPDLYTFKAKVSYGKYTSVGMFLWNSFKRKNWFPHIGKSWYFMMFYIRIIFQEWSVKYILWYFREESLIISRYL